MDKKAVLLGENLGYEISSTRTLFKGVQVSIESRARIALVGRNGVGKSTLLKIMAGEINPTNGSIYRHGIVYYLPQISTIREEIKADTVLDLLSDISEEWWKIEEILPAKFSTTLDLSLPIANLSGGELTKPQEPKVLLLDEPTNHMDLQALENLSQFLNDFDGAFVIVSHKPFFLDQVVDITWELTPEGIKVYGGNFSLYREQKETELAAALRTHEIARKELKRAKTSALQEQQRAAQSRRSGREKFLNGSIDRIKAGLLKSQGETTAGIAKKKHEAAVEKANQKVEETQVKTNNVTQVQLAEKSHKPRSLIDIQGAKLRVGDRLLIENIHLHISAGDRVAMAGANGSGKSSLAKAILGMKNSPAFLESGEVLLANGMKAVYLDQTYELVNRNRTIIENMQAANPNLNYQLLRQQLGHFLFKYDDVNKQASVLSGGELARLAIAMIGISEIDLLILDEPTNNLDIETVDQMVAGINEYQGAIWVISHDLDFLSRSGITKAFQLKDRTLRMTAYLPNELERYYQELVEA
ncbi:ABC-F family ATP-binding cassette domain-containing protein [Microseira wollei]|uniref:ABC transporter related n=1 Tax=Microseira wollei NIES-4236 TaxID=2530354 RepID=A0AAV3XHG0_9CYAN|nr:ABC-F family ATP-binding cassette domain-containing protein [Microseira wollei]GET42362.1 ABC transporter related [Microseira wollei NIES-4236]